MNKKIITAVFGCVLGAAFALSFTACNTADDADGTKISAEEWTKAFDATANSNCFTLEEVHKMTTFEGDANEDYKVVYGFTNEKVRREITENEQNGTVWSATDYIICEEQAYQVMSEDGISWFAYTASETLDSYKSNMFAYYNVMFAKEKNSEVFYELKDLYSSFNYDGGKYVGKLIYSDNIEVNVTVKINNNYVEYLEWSYEVGAGEEKSSVFFSFSFKNYGTTEITVPEEAQEAIDILKASN